MQFVLIFVLPLAAVFLTEFSSAQQKLNSGSVIQLTPEGRIFGGESALPGQFPYQVGIQFFYTDVASYFCGGTLIHPKWVLTAAHCTKDAKNMVVLLGGNVRLQNKVVYQVPKYNLIVHTYYEEEQRRNDIALIMIPKVRLSNEINVARLPAIATAYSNYQGESVIVSGWGKEFENSVVLPNKLRWGRMKTISNQECAAIYGPMITNANLCAASLDFVSPCDGDSGGPVVLESTGTLIGVISFSSKRSCELGLPTSFTRITRYLKWIQLNTGIKF